MTVTLITGTSSGIGLATALHLAKAGHEVFATMRSPERGGGQIREFSEAERLPLTLLPLDVDDDESVRNAVGLALERAGRIDVLVNNAGIGRAGTVEEAPLSQYREAMETNFFGAIRCIQAVLPQMRERGSGCIVNVSSIFGRLPGNPYCCSKWALECMSEELAHEVGAFGIRVAIIEPGATDTAWLSKPKGVMPSARSPYSRFEARKAVLIGALFEKPSPPERVAEVIAHAIETDQPRLRYIVGRDAERMIKGHEQMTDEERLEIELIEDDARYFVALSRAYGLDVQAPDQPPAKHIAARAPHERALRDVPARRRSVMSATAWRS